MKDVTDVTVIVHAAGITAIEHQVLEEIVSDATAGHCTVSIHDVSRKTPGSRSTDAVTVLDTIIAAVDAVGVRLHELGREDRPARVLIVIISDAEMLRAGLHSRECAQMRLIHQHDVYRWEAIYLATQHHAESLAREIGIQPAHALTFAPNRAALERALNALVRVVRGYAATGHLDGFTDDERAEAIEEHVPLRAEV